MNNILYETIFKRKSFHLFKNVGDEKLSNDELSDIKSAFSNFESLYSDIKTDIRIVKSDEVNFKRGAEYCVLIYSEVKDNYLMNVGYLGEQLDLYLVKNNIGTLWFGIGKADIQSYNNLEFVIMIGIQKISNDALYRKDMFKAKRKELNEIWEGEKLGIAEIVRFAPSACNTQPWFVKNENNILTVYRYKKENKRGIMPTDKVIYYNRIDIGIFLCILEICLNQNNIKYERQLYLDNKDEEYVKVGEYKIRSY